MAVYSADIPDGEIAHLFSVAAPQAIRYSGDSPYSADLCSGVLAVDSNCVVYSINIGNSGGDDA